jgi:hypothetical protein
MWDDHTVAWEIRAPWWKRSQYFKRGRWHPPLVTIWHVDPHGDRRWPCGGRTDTRRRWRFHVHHWKLQIHPWQDLKRYLFERCAACGKGYPWGYAPVQHGKGTVHVQCSRVIGYRVRVERLEEVVRAAVNGYCRTLDMEPAEALKVLLPGSSGDLPAWRTYYTAQSVMGLLDNPAPSEPS